MDSSLIYVNTSKQGNLGNVVQYTASGSYRNMQISIKGGRQLVDFLISTGFPREMCLGLRLRGKDQFCHVFPMCDHQLEVSIIYRVLIIATKLQGDSLPL